MKIAIVSSYLGSQVKGGAESYVRDLARSLSRRHDVVVLSATGSDPAFEVPIVRLPGLQPLAHDEGRAGKVAWHLRDQWMPGVHRALKHELGRVAPDVVQTNNVQGLSAAVFTATAHLPHVHTAHDLSLLCVRAAMVRNGRPCAGRCADCRIQRSVRVPLARRSVDHVAAVSSAVRRHLLAARVATPDRISVVRLGTAPIPGRPRSADPGNVRIGFLGTLARHKGVLTLLTAFRSAPAAWSLVIAGAGPLEEDVRRAVAADGRIAYPGHVVGDAKNLLLDSVDVIVIPSECEEAASLVGVEAAARGIPAVVSARGGLVELPEARSFRSGSADELLRALTWFSQDDRLADASVRLLERHDEFMWSTHARQIERILSETADRPPKAPQRMRETPTL